jgi:hypothetical protein
MHPAVRNVKWLTIRRAWLLLARLGRRKYAINRESRRENHWTLLKQQVDSVIIWRVNKWRQHNCDLVLQELRDWMVERYGDKICVRKRSVDCEHYRFRAHHLPTSFVVGLKSIDKKIHLGCGLLKAICCTLRQTDRYSRTCLFYLKGVKWASTWISVPIKTLTSCGVKRPSGTRPCVLQAGCIYQNTHTS